MAGLGLIATGAAFLNYQKAKQEYKQACLEDNTDAILATIAQYNTSKYALLDAYDKDAFVPKETDFFLPIPVLNVGMMVGEKCRMQGVLALKNNTNRIFEISNVECVFKVYKQDTLLGIWKATNRMGADGEKEYKCLPEMIQGDEYHVSFDFAEMAKLSLEDMMIMTPALKEAREAIRTANQRGSYKPPIGLCAVPTIIAPSAAARTCVTADIWFKYNGFDEEHQGIAEFKNVGGSLVYKGEAYYPANNG